MPSGKVRRHKSFGSERLFRFSRNKKTYRSFDNINDEAEWGRCETVLRKPRVRYDFKPRMHSKEIYDENQNRVRTNSGYFSDSETLRSKSPPKHSKSNSYCVSPSTPKTPVKGILKNGRDRTLRKQNSVPTVSTTFRNTDAAKPPISPTRGTLWVSSKSRTDTETTIWDANNKKRTSRSTELTSSNSITSKSALWNSSKSVIDRGTLCNSRNDRRALCKQTSLPVLLSSQDLGNGKSERRDMNEQHFRRNVQGSNPERESFQKACAQYYGIVAQKR